MNFVFCQRRRRACNRLQSTERADVAIFPTREPVWTWSRGDSNARPFMRHNACVEGPSSTSVGIATYTQQAGSCSTGRPTQTIEIGVAQWQEN